jgi:hypothetical protein
MSAPRDSPNTRTEPGSSHDNAGDVPTGTAQITQALLAAYEDLRSLERQKHHLRAYLLRLLDQGAEVEPGPLTLEVKEREERRLSFARLRRVVGQAEAEQLRSQIEPVLFRYLRVHRVVQHDPANGRQAEGWQHDRDRVGDAPARGWSPRRCLPL